MASGIGVVIGTGVFTLTGVEARLVRLLTVSWIGFAMGRDGLLPPAVAKVSPPHRGAGPDHDGLRRTRPELHRPFRVPLSPVLPGLAAAACLYLVLNLSIETWLRFLVWPALGLLIHAAYGYRDSRVGAAAGRR